jgi:hypothetical protein
MPSMQKRSLWLRTPLLLLSLLQISVPGAVAWADARLGEATGPVHIESHSTNLCVRVHPADCVFHRFLTAPLARNTATVLRIREGQGIRWTPLSHAYAATRADLTLPDSRAPPTPA